MIRRDRAETKIQTVYSVEEQGTTVHFVRRGKCAKIFLFFVPVVF